MREVDRGVGWCRRRGSTAAAGVGAARSRPAGSPAPSWRARCRPRRWDRVPRSSAPSASRPEPLPLELLEQLRGAGDRVVDRRLGDRVRALDRDADGDSDDDHDQQRRQAEELPDQRELCLLDDGALRGIGISPLIVRGRACDRFSRSLSIPSSSAPCTACRSCPCAGWRGSYGCRG